MLRGPIRTLPAAWSAFTLAAAVAPIDPAAAERTLEASCGPELGALPQPFRLAAFALLARCRLALDRPAAHAVAAARRCAEESGLALGAGRRRYRRCSARAAPRTAAPGRRARAAAADAAGSVGAVGAVVEAASARQLTGRALAEAGATEQAIAELRRAAGEFDQCGARRPRRQHQLRALGDRGRPAAPDPERERSAWTP